ncbi:hypothetical protein Taro_011640 [Colocasia esculenta]|uniref:CCHC-type domain-containing protein n=1 Tax=Colocasia esculenta TaxID=4460 RepID=A0A843U1X7_COLES|nr:hypothetical protein [Colocasia esculenta]
MRKRRGVVQFPWELVEVSAWIGRFREQGRGRPEVEESQQSTARQPVTPPGYRCYNCNQPGHLIRNCPYPREYGYGRGVQQQQQPQQFQQLQSGRGRGAPQQRGRGRVMAIARAQAEPSNMIEEISEMADRRDWGGGGYDLEESTQRMIERI